MIYSLLRRVLWKYRKTIIDLHAIIVRWVLYQDCVLAVVKLVNSKQTAFGLKAV